MDLTEIKTTSTMKLETETEKAIQTMRLKGHSKRTFKKEAERALHKRFVQSAIERAAKET